MTWLLVFIWLAEPGVTVTSRIPASDPMHCMSIAQEWVDEVHSADAAVVSFECKEKK